MSRGLGKLQAKLLAVLEQNKTLPVSVAAWMAYDLPPTADGHIDIAAVTPSMRAATERALLGLQKRGLAFATHRSRFGWEWARRDKALASIAKAVSVFGNNGARGYSCALIDAWADGSA
jgi:hypothetical protein